LKESLLRQGFSNWSKKEFFLYIRLCETNGRDSFERVQEGLPNKSLEDVKEYSKMFWKNWEKIENG
jgi:SWI/SNF-related matrix-associated actin-dependent regulator of chromatin subfamily A member 5